MCNPLATPLTCTANAVASSGFGYIADSAGQAATSMIVEAMTWWTHTGSVNPDNAATHTLQGYTTPIAMAILVCSVLVQSGRMIISRRKDPAINVGIGLIRYAAVTAVGLILLRLALQAADDLCTQLAGQAMIQFSAKMTGLMAMFSQQSVFLSFCLSLALLVLSAIQWLLGFLRQAAILVLAVMLPLAASGSINDSTRPWLRKLTGWLISLICYKPMAAMIYLIGFTYIGNAQDLGAFMTGLMVLALAVVAMPTMMKFFSWGTADTSGGGTGGVIAGGALGAIGVSKLIGGGGGGGGGGAVHSAAAMERSGPGSTSQPPPPPGGSSAPALANRAPAGAGSGGSSSPTSGTAGSTTSAGSAAPAATGTASATAGAGTTAASGAGAGAAAAAGPAGAAAAGAVQLAQGAAQVGKKAAGEMTDGGQQ